VSLESVAFSSLLDEINQTKRVLECVRSKEAVAK